MNTLVKGEASPRKPMLAKVGKSTRKPMSMGVKGEQSPRKPIIVNNLSRNKSSFSVVEIPKKVKSVRHQLIGST